ncbi:phosphatase PAP2 family protein [Chelativorans sp. AA-79]|uniref:phosphatase PAP2 family protein n=1 Tax=Chelativorans sp. AA-79 TaxID=3028735 RepID=UPI0023F8CF3C|nr:phosphatase PAP2 family protein [Chelativorans sp. AA-79]WEX07948.1 phosphatase PAP2 family protein [Chelativorans sp. AA-79]
MRFDTGEMIGTATTVVKDMKRWPEAVLPAMVIGIMGLGLFAFLSIADEMGEGEVRAWDEWLFLAFRNPADPDDPLGPPWLEEAALEVTALGGYTLIILTLAAVLGLLLVTRRYGPALYAFLSVGSGALVSSLSKQFYDRPRPDLVPQLDIVHTASFPSGHALVTTVAYLTLAALVIRFFDDLRVRLYVAGVAVFVSLIVGISRVYLGVHWPSDVAAGWALGAAWASLAWLVVAALQFLRRRRTARSEE